MEPAAPAKPRQVPVCMKCGNRDVRPQTIHEGLWAGGGELLGHWTCDRCGHIGAPFLVDLAEAPDPKSESRWDESSPGAPVEATAEVPERRQPEPVFGTLLIVVGVLFALPLLGLAASGAFGTGVGLVVGFFAAFFGLLVGYAVARIGWKKLRPE